MSAKDEVKSDVIRDYQSVLIGDDVRYICSISPAKFDNLIKVILNIAEEDSPLVIKDGELIRKYQSGICCADVSNILDKNIELQIIDPKKQLRLLKSFRNNNDIDIIDDNENMRFILTDGEVKLFLPKADTTILQNQISLPDLENYHEKYSVKFDKEARNIINNLTAKASYIDYLIQDDALKGIYIPDTAVYIFNEYISDMKSVALDETTADLALRSSLVQFPQTGNNFVIYIAKNNDEDLYYLVLTCNIGQVKFMIYEMLEVSTGNNIII